MKTSRLILFLFIGLLNYSISYAQYTGGSISSATRTLVAGSGSETAQMNGHIASLGAAGGTIIIPSGTYQLRNIRLTSKIHVRIDKDATIKPDAPGSGNYAIFKLTTANKNASHIQNVKIYCGNCTSGTPANNGTTYQIDLTGVSNKNIRVFDVEKVNNFQISNFFVKDANTKFAALTMTPFLSGSVNENDPLSSTIRSFGYPTNGTVKKANIINANYGYGLVQMQAGHNIRFNDLYGTGGITLRLESGAKIAFVGTLVDPTTQITGIVARNINSKNGNCALMLNPHGRIHGSVNASNIKSNGSAFAVKIEGGFTDVELKRNSGNQPNTNAFKSKFKKGFYEGNVTITNITATFGNGAQIKSKDWALYPQSIKGSGSYSNFSQGTNSSGGVKINTPSVASVGYLSKDNKNVTISNPRAAISGNNIGNGEYSPNISGVNGNGFNSCLTGISHTVYEEDKNKVCNGTTDGGNTGSGSGVTPAQCKSQCRADFPKGSQRRACINACNSSTNKSISNDENNLKIELSENSIGYKLYPNPATDKLYIDYPKNSNVQIYNHTGMLIKSIQNIPNKAEIDISRLQNGLYLIKIESGTETFNKKLLVN